jgi:cytochrome c553
MKPALLFALAVAVLSGCDRPPELSPSRSSAMSRTNAPAPDSTRAMGAASSPASSPKAPASASAPAADVAAGRAIALQGAPGAAACASCHGVNAEGNAQAAIPRLAGLARPYIEHQLDSFADGTRAQPVMTQIAGALSAAQRSQVAAYFTSLRAPALPAPAASAPEPAIVRGDAARNIPACASCHGASASNAPNAGPELAGQNEAYLASALAAWKSGARHNDTSGKMPAIAKALTDAEARAAAAYYGALPASAAGR